MRVDHYVQLYPNIFSTFNTQYLTSLRVVHKMTLITFSSDPVGNHKICIKLLSRKVNVHTFEDQGYPKRLVVESLIRALRRPTPRPEPT